MLPPYLPAWTFDLSSASARRAEVGYKSDDEIEWRWQTGAVCQRPADWLEVGVVVALLLAGSRWGSSWRCCWLGVLASMIVGMGAVLPVV